MIKATAHVPARVAILQPPGKDLVQGGSRHNSQLTQLGYSVRKPPTRDTRTHPALNNHRIAVHEKNPSLSRSHDSTGVNLYGLREFLEPHNLVPSRCTLPTSDVAAT